MAADDEDAIQIAKSTPMQVIASDVCMPRLDGPGLYEELRRRERHILVVLMSTVNVDVDLPEVRFAGRPFDLDRLLHIIANVLQPAPE